MIFIVSVTEINALRCVLGGLFHLAHLTAALCATTAYLGAALHHVIADRFTRFSTDFTDIGTGATDRYMQRGLARHEIRGDLTDLNAIRHEFDMLGFRMRTTLLKAMRIKNLLAFVTALPTGCNAILHNVHDFLLGFGIGWTTRREGKFLV